MPRQAVLFDMDGVLTSTDEYHYLSWQAITAELELEFDRRVYENLLGRSRRHSLEILLGPRRLPEAELQAILQRKNAYFLAYVRQMGPADLRPGVAVLLDELRRAAWPCAVASSSANAQVVLAQLGIRDCFAAVVDSNSGLRPKPAPDLFLAAAAALQVAPADCVVIEDSRAGVQAGLEAGAHVLGVGDPLRLAGATRIVPSLEEIHLPHLLALLAPAGSTLAG